MAGRGDAWEDDRQARIMAAVTEPDTTAGAGKLAGRLRDSGAAATLSRDDRAGLRQQSGLAPT